jgi:hypothetical protein
MDDYLSADFDAAKATMPYLRSILVQYKVQYKSNAKKPELVALFNEHVKPLRDEILASRAAVKPSAKGIIDA